MFQQLTLNSLSEIDNGRVAEAFMQDLKHVVQDCIDRPSDKNPRVVTLEFTVVPIPENNQGIVECSDVDGNFKIKSKVPTRKSKTYSFRANKQGQLCFSTNSPENVDQTHFDDVNPATGKVDRGPTPK